MTTVDTSHHDAHGEHDKGIHHAHAAPASLFFKTLIGLLILTVLTVVISRFHFGSANMFVAMFIAAMKASLVMTFFMHLKWDTPINQIAILSSFLFLALLFIFTLSDFATRGRVDKVLLQKAPLDPSPKLGVSAPKHGGDH